MSERGTVVFLADTLSYRTEEFAAAAAAAGVDLVIGSDRCHVLAELFDRKFLILDFGHPEESARAVVEFARGMGVAAVVAAGDRMAVVAALANEALGLPHNPPSAARAAANKRLLREALARAGVPAPAHRIVPLDAPPEEIAAVATYPCVVKPLLLSGSRGVIRADDPAGFVRAFRRLERILRDGAIRMLRDPENERVLVEEFVPGAEVALEGILTGGALRTLALFDKPDPLDGPYFEETIYITPSGLPRGVQEAVEARAQEAARALGLVTGPVHAELRVNDRGVWVIEVAARSIGGLCSRALRFGMGMSLEELILRHAVGESVEAQAREGRASGVMMIPIPSAGILREVRGEEDARAVQGISEVAIAIRPGQTLTPLPEGASYLGFLFARGETPAAVEDSLRRAHAALGFSIAPNANPAAGAGPAAGS